MDSLLKTLKLSHIYFIFFYPYQGLFHFFRETGRLGEREKKRERKGGGEHRCERNTEWLPSCKRPDQESNHNMGMCPNQESNQWPLVTG